MIEELELKHIVGYLPNGLACQAMGEFTEGTEFDDNPKPETFKVRGIINNSVSIERCGYRELVIITDVFPILRSLLDYRDISSKAMSDLNIDVSDQIKLSSFTNGDIPPNQVEHGIIQICYQNHIDFQDLIGNKLAVDINTLNK